MGITDGMRLAPLAPFLALASISLATVRYSVTAEPANKRLVVEIEFEPKGSHTALQIPNWAPGSYNLGNNARRIKEVTAAGQAGVALTVGHPGDNTWTVDTKGAKTARVRYTI